MLEDGMDAFLNGNKSKSMDIWTRACNYGDLRSCNILGSSYYTIGVQQNNKSKVNKAYSLWKKACDNGSGAACSSIGSLYYYGHSFRIDKKQAMKFYLKACDYNILEGCQHYIKLQKEGF